MLHAVSSHCRIHIRLIDIDLTQNFEYFFILKACIFSNTFYICVGQGALTVTKLTEPAKKKTKKLHMTLHEHICHSISRQAV